jgi:hypothetical protein
MNATMTGTATYTHVGSRASVGGYRVTADACRKPGKVHALNTHPSRHRTFLGLCGVIVAERSNDEFCQQENQVAKTTENSRVTCKKCRKMIEGSK